MKPWTTILCLTALFLCTACPNEPADEGAAETAETAETASEGGGLVSKYTTVRLGADLSGLSDNQRKMLPLLIDAAKMMDGLFWRQAYGDKEALLASIADEELKRFAEINYGPWDRLDGNAPFLDGVGAKPDGARFYPEDMTREEFEAAVVADPLDGVSFRSLYTVIRRNGDGELKPSFYHDEFRDELTAVASKLREAAALAEDDGFRDYLVKRADALLDSRYRASDMAWLDMDDNALDVVIGPIETYEDQLYGYKAAFEAYVLIKDRAWSDKLARFAAFLPDLQRGLPVPEAYKAEMPGTDADLNAYDVVYYAGDCNAGSKTIAINLPNDETVQLEKGTRRLQLKNAMQAKFDKILIPISELLIAEDQREKITFDAFFANTMFHEVAHGLGIKRTLDGEGTVRQALEEEASAVEEGKADILGLYMITELSEAGETDGDLDANYVTFMTSVFRSIRFGASSAHGKANLARFNFFRERGAISRSDDGIYRVDFDKMVEAMDALSEKLLRFQGDGDKAGVEAFMAQYATAGAELQADLDRLASAGIPVDIVFEQGVDVLGL